MLSMLSTGAPPGVHVVHWSTTGYSQCCPERHETMRIFTERKPSEDTESSCRGPLIRLVDLEDLEPGTSLRSEVTESLEKK